jgi:formylglycine-generating enzyme required for sulfatase activity
VYISHEDAEAFCRRLSALPAEKAAGRVYRLPTEAEWEHGCRGGNRQATKYHFGDSDADLDKYAWYAKNAGDIGGKYAHREEKVSGLFSGELSSYKLPRWEDQNVQTKRAGFITP